MKNIQTLSIPINFGQKNPGVSEGSNILYDSYFRKKFNTMKNVNYEHKKFIHKGIDNEKTLFMLQKQINKEKEKIDFSIFLGGDHSMSMGTISGQFINYDKEKCVIWLDAHTDCNNIKFSQTGNIHGMPVSALLGDLEEPYTNYKCLNYDEICYIGTRSIDPYEKEYIKEKNILNMGIKEVKEDLDNVLDRLDKFINGREVHISFDIDIMDPEFISSTGTLEKNGVNMEQMEKILLFLTKYNVISMDIVEFNPELGDLEKTKKNLFILLDIFLNNLFS
jgi:arginase